MSHIQDAPFRFEPRLNDVLCSQPLPRCHQTFMTSNMQPVEISFPTPEQAASSNPFAVIPLGGTIVVDEAKLAALVEQYRLPSQPITDTNPRPEKGKAIRPSVAALMSTIKGYHLYTGDYVDTILEGQTHSSAARVGPLFGQTCNPFFPLDRGVVYTGTDVTLKNKHASKFELQQDAYVYELCLLAWTVAHKRWLIADHYDESQPNAVMVLDPLDLKGESKEDEVANSHVEPADWLTYDWSFMTYYTKVSKALGLNTHKVVRVDRVNNADFVSLTIHDYEGMMARTYPELERHSFQALANWKTGVTLWYWKRKDKLDLHFPQFFQHAWFSPLRPVLRITQADMAYADRVNLMYEIVANCFLADSNTNNQKHKMNGCPDSLLTQHRLPAPYTVFRLPDQGTNGRLFWTLNKHAVRELKTAQSPRAAFWHPCHLDVPLYFETIREQTITDSLVEMSPQMLADLALLEGVPMGDYPLATTYFHLVRAGVPVSRVYRIIFHMRYARQVEECRMGKHADCQFPTIARSCPLSNWLNETADAVLSYWPAGAIEGVPMTHEEYVDQGLEKKATAWPHPELLQRLSNVLKYTRPVDYFEEIEDAFTDLGTQIDKVCDFSLGLVRALAVVAKVHPFEELMPRAHLLATWRSYPDSFAHYCASLTERLRQPLLMKHLVKRQGLALRSPNGLDEDALLTTACQLLHEAKLSEAFDIAIQVPEETLNRFPFWSRGDAQHRFFQSDALYLLHELFKFCVLQPFLLSYAAYWAPAPGPSLWGQPGVFWPQARLPLTMDLDLDKLDEEADADENMEEAVERALAGEPSASIFTRKKKSHHATPVDLDGSAAAPKTRTGKGSRGGKRGAKAGRGSVIAGRRESRLSMPSISSQMMNLVYRLTKKTNTHIDIDRLANLQTTAADTWNLKTKNMTVLMQECAEMNEKTDINRVLTVCMLILSLKRRCRSRRDADTYPQLVALQFFVHKLQNLLRPLWNGTALLAEIPDDAVASASSSSSSSRPTDKMGDTMEEHMRSSVNPEVWDTDTSTPIVKFLYEKLTRAADQTLTAEDLDVLMARLAMQRCRFDRAREHVIQALIIIADFTNQGLHTATYPFLGDEKRVMCGINLTMFMHRYSQFAFLRMAEEDKSQYVVTPPTEEKERLAYKLVVCVLQHLNPQNPVLANVAAIKTDSEGRILRESLEELPLLFVSQPPCAPAVNLRQQLPVIPSVAPVHVPDPSQINPFTISSRTDADAVLKPLPLSSSPESSLDFLCLSMFD